MTAESLLGGYTEDELKKAFELVAPKPNWKMPIDALISSITPIKKRKLISFAVMFYTGGIAVFKKTPSGKIRVTSPGYYACIGA
jgi:hypothetical protein